MDEGIAAGCRRAAAIAYTQRDADGGRAPRVVAKGESWLAEQIIARARAAGVPVHESRELVALLLQVDLDAHIPPALYVAVAEVLAWVYRVEGRVAPLAAARDDAATAASDTTGRLERP
jgi:flagellar biosynthesis protein